MNNLLHKCYTTSLAICAILYLSLGLEAQSRIRFKVKGENFEINTRGTGTMLGEANPTSQKVFTVTAGTEVVLEGDITQFALYGGNIEYLDISEASALRVLTLNGDNTRSRKLVIESLNLTNSPITTLYAYGATLTELNMSSLTKLTKLQLGRTWDSDASRLGNITLPTSNTLRDILFVNAGGVNLTPQINLEIVNIAGRYMDGVLTLDNHPKLKTVSLTKVSNLSEIHITNAPAFQKLSVDVGISKSVKLSGTAATSVVFGTASGWGVKNTLESIDLSNNNITSIDISGGHFKSYGLKLVDISRNRLSAEQISAIIAQLYDATNATEAPIFLAFAGEGDQNAFTQAHRDALAAKGWRWERTTAIHELNKQAISVYPSATTDAVEINGGPFEPIRVYDLMGSLVDQSITNETGYSKLSLGSLPRGSYIITVGKAHARITLR